MTKWAAGGSTGARVQAARKALGLRTTRDLADLIEGSTVTEAVIENIESGRKVSLDVSQLFSIAMALGVPPSYLLVPIGDPDTPIDLPNLSNAFKGMTAGQFDAWMSGLSDGEYKPITVHERNARNELDAVRRWMALHDEILRLEMLSLEHGEPNYVERGRPRSIELRMKAAEQELSELHTYLTSAGWNLGAGPRPEFRIE